MAAFPTQMIVSSDPAFAIFGNVLEVGTFLYMVYTEFSIVANQYRMAKSVDGGASWFTNVGGDGPVSIGFSDVSTVTDGASKIFLIHQTVGFPTPIAVQVFDITTDTWTTLTNTTNKIIGDTDSVLRGFYRAADAKLLIWSSARTVSGFPPTTTAKSYFFLFDVGTLTFGPWIQCGSTTVLDPLEWRMQTAVQGNGSDVVMLFDVTDPTYIGTFNTVYQVLTAPSTVGSLQTIQASVSVNNTSLGIRAISDGTRIFIGVNVADGDPTKVVIYSTLVTPLNFTVLGTVHSTGVRCSTLAVCIVPAKQIVCLIDEVDNIVYYVNDFTSQIPIGVFPFSGATTAFLNSFASLPLIIKGSIAWIDPVQGIAFFGPIPPSAPTPPFFSPIVDAKNLGYFVLPDPSVHCKFENKPLGKGSCVYVYDTHKSK
jgi:hypothetical protein